jgi:hypothetical protein
MGEDFLSPENEQLGRLHVFAIACFAAKCRRISPGLLDSNFFAMYPFFGVLLYGMWRGGAYTSSSNNTGALARIDAYQLDVGPAHFLACLMIFR